MKVRVGTINELTGEGIEYLIDRPTRTVVLAKFFNGWMVRDVPVNEVDADEVTVVSSDEFPVEVEVGSKFN